MGAIQTHGKTSWFTVIDSKIFLSLFFRSTILWTQKLISIAIIETSIRDALAQNYYLMTQRGKDQGIEMLVHLKLQRKLPIKCDFLSSV